MDTAVPSQGAVAPAVWHARFDDPHAMALAQREAAIEYLSLGDRTYSGEVTMVDFGRFALQSARDGAHITRGVTHPDRVTVLFATGAVNATVNGWPVDSVGAVLFGPGSEIRCHVPKPLAWVGYTFDANLCRSWLDGEDLPASGDFAVAGDLIAKAPALRRLALDLAAAARGRPGTLAQGSVTSAVQEIIGLALSRGIGARQAEGRALRQRMRIVAAADAYLDHHRGHAVYTEDLVQALGVPTRTLHNAFSAIYGMGPHQVLQLRRLNLVHAALRRSDGDARLVKTVALEHGFWHLGRFAQQYRRLFGETPSETLARRDARGWFGYRSAAGTA